MSWPTVALADVCKLENGDRGKNYPNKSAFVDAGIPFVNAGDLNGGKVATDGLSYISKDHFDRLSNGKFGRGDFLFCLRGTLGKFAFVDREISGGIASSLIILRPSPDLHPAFLNSYLGSKLCTEQIDQFRNGAAQPNLAAASLKQFQIPLPPLEEQKRIAGILDQADALRRLRTRALEKLNTLGQAIFHEMFGAGIADKKMWPRFELSELISDDDRVNYGVVQPGDHDPEGVPIIRAGDLAAPFINFETVKRISKDIDANYVRSRLKGGEILIGCVGSIGTAMIAPKEFEGANIARAVARVAIDPEKCDPEFVAEYLRSDLVQQYFQKEVRLVAQPTLNIKQIRETEIVVPPVELQKIFLQRLGVTKANRTRAIESLLKQETLFASLQNVAFRGEL